jgi:hypothetical protein
MKLLSSKSTLIVVALILFAAGFLFRESSIVDTNEKK